jgi:hypothetical protein
LSRAIWEKQEEGEGERRDWEGMADILGRQVDVTLEDPAETRAQSRQASAGLAGDGLPKALRSAPKGGQGYEIEAKKG